MTDQSTGDAGLPGLPGWTRGPNGELIPPTNMPNFGASTPMSDGQTISGAQGSPLSLQRGGAMFRGGMTPGAPSMGYPSVASPTGMSLNSVPQGGWANFLNRFNPISSANAAELPHPTGAAPPQASGLGLNPNDPYAYHPTPAATVNALGPTETPGPTKYATPYKGPGPSDAVSNTIRNWVKPGVENPIPFGRINSVNPTALTINPIGSTVQPPVAPPTTVWHPSNTAAPIRPAAPPAPRSVNLGYGTPQAAPPQANSPFTMVLRPNAPAESGGRQGGNSGGPPLGTALDLSGWGRQQQQQPTPLAQASGVRSWPTSGYDVAGLFRNLPNNAFNS